MRKLSFLFDYLLLGSFLYYFVFIWKIYPFSIGGSLVFISVIGFTYYLSFVYKEFSLDFTLLSLIMFSLMGLNHVAYIEHTKGLSVNVVMGFFIFLFIIIIAILWLIQRPFGRTISQEAPHWIELKKRVVGFIALRIMHSLIFIIITAIILLVLKEEPIVKNHIFSFSTFSIGWLLIGLILISTRKRKTLDNLIPYLIPKKADMNITSLKKWFFPITIGILIFGSGLEIMRGLWIFWLCSWLAFVLTIITNWTTWKYVFLRENNHNSHKIAEIQENMYIALPALSDPKYMLKYVGIGTLMGSLYAFILFFIWFFW